MTRWWAGAALTLTVALPLAWPLGELAPGGWRFEAHRAAQCPLMLGVAGAAGLLLAQAGPPRR